MKFPEAAALVLAEAEIENSKTSAHSRRWFAANITKVWGERDLAEVSRREVQAWVNQRRQEIAPASLASELSFFRRCYRAAWQAGEDVICPAQGIRLPKINNRRERVLTLEEIALLRGVMTPENWSLVEFSMMTGVRRLEQFRLKRADVRFFTRPDSERVALARILDSKTGLGRNAALNPRAAAIAADWMARESGKYVFWTNRSPERARVAHCAYEMLVKAAREVGIENLHWHDLRHCCATRAAENGASPREIQQLLGHKSVQHTERYINTNHDGPLWKAAMAVCG